MSTANSRTASRHKPRRAAGLAWWPVLAAVALIAVVIVVALGTTDANDSGQPTEPAVGGESLPAHDPMVASDPAIGSLVPSVLGSDFDGNLVNPTRNERAKLFVFLAHWCTHCRAELPILVDWLEAGGARDLQVVGVVTLTDPLRPNFPPRPWIEAGGWPGVILVDGGDSQVAAAYGLTATPYFVVTDAEDRVVARASGELPTSELDRLVDLAS